MKFKRYKFELKSFKIIKNNNNSILLKLLVIYTGKHRSALFIFLEKIKLWISFWKILIWYFCYFFDIFLRFSFFIFHLHLLCIIHKTIYLELDFILFQHIQNDTNLSGKFYFRILSCLQEKLESFWKYICSIYFYCQLYWSRYKNYCWST